MWKEGPTEKASRKFWIVFLKKSSLLDEASVCEIYVVLNLNLFLVKWDRKKCKNKLLDKDLRICWGFFLHVETIYYF